ncbi:MAG: TolB family protein [Sphingomonadales bacterium]
MNRWTGAVMAVALALLAGGALAGKIDFGKTRDGEPLENLPEGTRLISGFGERPVFSPDGKKLAFIGRSYGDAFEYDIATGKVRNLTAHTAHAGFLRVHYLPDGGFLLLGPRRQEADRQVMRISKIEMWWMDKDAEGAILPLDQHVSEGIAVSRKANRVAWAILHPETSKPEDTVEEYTAIMVAELVMRDGAPVLANKRELVRRPSKDCILEAQDFRDDDREVTLSCYDIGGIRLSLGKFGHIVHSAILGVRVADGTPITYHDIRDGAFNEIEGIGPKGDYSLVDCGPGYGKGLEICRIELAAPEHTLTRLTHYMNYGAHRVSNGVVSPDGKWMAYQFGRGSDEAGVGMGILLGPMPPP